MDRFIANNIPPAWDLPLVFKIQYGQIYRIMLTTAT